MLPEISIHESSGKRCFDQQINALTNSHENIIDIHGSLGRGFHEQETVVISIRLCLLQTLFDNFKMKYNWEKALNIIFLHVKFIYISNLKVYSSLVRDVCLVSGQSDHYVGTGLSLQLLHPVFRSCESILIKQKTSINSVDMKIFNFSGNILFISLHISEYSYVFNNENVTSNQPQVQI